MWQFYKRARRELVFLGLSFLVYLILFSAWYYWWGGTNWAARFLVPMLPFLVLLCAPLVELILTSPKTPARVGLTILFGLIQSITGIVQAWASVKGLKMQMAATNAKSN